jgi:hypothetical protein
MWGEKYLETGAKGIFNTVIPAMAISPSNPKTLYAEQQSFQELVSQDGGIHGI